MKINKNQLFILKNYLSFTRKDMKGILSLCILIAVLVLAPLLLQYCLNGGQSKLDYKNIQLQYAINSSAMKQLKNSVSSKYEAQGDKFIRHQEAKENKVYLNNRLNVNEKIGLAHEFKFDPNTCSESTWNLTGLAPYKIKMILHYLQKGGNFKSADAIHKIYCLNDSDCNRLIPHIRLAVTNSKWISQNQFPYKENRFKSKLTSYESSTWNAGNKSFNGKINLNKADFSTFHKLNKLSYKNICDILRYRESNGEFTDIRELKNLGLIDAQTYSKVIQFLTL